VAALLEIALPYLLGFFVAVGFALVAHPVSKGVVGWLAEKFVNIPLIGPLSLKQALRLNEWVANQISPNVAATGSRVALWFNGLGEASKYDHDLAYRQSLALANFATWLEGPKAFEILKKAELQAKTAAQKNALTKAPPLPQKRITQHEVDIEFQKIIEKEFVKHLKQDYPQFDWEPGRWRKWLGVLPALGGAVVTAPGKPKTKPAPAKVKTVRPAVPIAPPQPTTLPHTDDSPYPEPGTQTAPGVISAKDKWARGQIVKLRDYEKETRRHLGPLAFLTIPIAGISTLIGLLECKNVRQVQGPFCALNDISGLLGLIAGLVAIEEGFSLVDFGKTLLAAQTDVVNEILPFITEFKDATL
jgi:hypothetical protein